jgi:hypothetical protein
MAQESFSTHWGPSTLGLRQYWATAAPSASTDIGPYSVGDVVWNTAPAAGGATYMGWVCTTAGATGATSTWKGFGLIQA